MATISVRVPDEMKEKMERYPEINWSEVIRNKLAERLRNELDRNLSRALLLSEQVSDEVPGEEVKDRNTAEIIREWRTKR